jgi:hypothetical protein
MEVSFMKKAAALALLAVASAATAHAQHNVNLAWTASADAATNPSLTYNIYRSSTCTGAFTKLNSTPVSSTNYLDTSMQQGSYCYQVTSVLSGTESEPSNQAAVVIGSPQVPEQIGCPRRGNLITWLRCVRSESHAQPKRELPPP